MTDIYIHYGTDLTGITYELMAAARIADRLRPEMTVGIKPNLVVARPADGGATTHPEIVEGVIRYVRDAGVRRIAILEGSWVGDGTQKAFRNCGYAELAEKYGASLIDTKHDKVVERSSKGLTLSLCESALKVDYLVNVPVLKGHCQTGMTCCLKNLKGCIPDSEKRRYHTLGLHKPIAALNTLLRPALHIIDSVCGDPTFEEGGNPVEANRILLGFDPVLLDSYAAQLLGFEPDDIEYLRLAKEYGVGTYADSKTEIVELNAHNRPKTAGSRRVQSSTVKKYSQFIDEDGACSACYAALVSALHQTNGLGYGRIRIGQGYKGKTSKGLGTGNCAAGCEHYVKGCPPKASDIAAMIRQLRL
ncbi:MAG TPA: DUF362 domain-containing protein [Anaerovoracaceae bacterium]|nr:DUF362 domain-containing protein [Anaerovoracaceae bacterium]